MTAHYVVHGKVGYSGGLAFAHEAEAIAEAEKAAKDEWIGPIWVEKTEVIWTNAPKTFPLEPDGLVKWDTNDDSVLTGLMHPHRFMKQFRNESYCYCGRREEHEMHK